MGSEKRPLFLFSPFPLCPAPFNSPLSPTPPTTQQQDYNIYSIAKAIHNQSSIHLFILKISLSRWSKVKLNEADPCVF